MAGGDRLRAIDELRARYQSAMLGATNTETIKAEQLREHDLGTSADADRDGNVRAYGMTPAGRHAARGVPLLPVSGTQPGTDPHQALMHKLSGNRDRFGDPPPREEDGK